jgi:hypothetical protein
VLDRNGASAIARRGSVKRLSVDQEDTIARIYGGTRSPSSGGAAHDYGDVRCPGLLIECKVTMQEKRPKILKEFEKIAAEAWAEGREPALALRYFAPESILADTDGWVDLMVRRVADDRVRHDPSEVEADGVMDMIELAMGGDSAQA